jgi:ABC-type dipeptide/oligopeptide/nickel transport system permease component
MVFAIGGVSVPAFVVGPLLVIVFALGLGLVPTQGWGRPEQMILPVITLALTPAALMARYTRAAMLEVTRMDYVRTARAKGLGERTVVLRHALRNALIPVTTVAGVLLATVITGSFYVEFVFNIPGLGRYFVTAVTNRDYPVLMGITLLFASAITVVNLLVDLFYGYLDPRIRYD